MFRIAFSLHSPKRSLPSPIHNPDIIAILVWTMMLCGMVGCGSSDSGGDGGAYNNAHMSDTGLDSTANTGPSQDTSSDTETDTLEADTAMSDTLPNPADADDGPADTGVTPMDTGDLPDDTGDLPMDTGDLPTDTGDLPMDTDASPADTAPAPDVMEPRQVEAMLPVVEGRTTCVPLDNNERVAAVSPEGDAWLVHEDGADTTVRVVDPEGAERVAPVRVELPAITLMRAWSATYANVIATETLWRLEDLQRISLTPPSQLTEPQSWCGELGIDGMVLGGDGLVFEARDGMWWSWQIDVEASQVPALFVERQGECFGPDNILWALGGDGTLWQIREVDARPLRRFEALIDAAATGNTLAVLDGELLWLGPDPWVAWAFEAETPTRLSASSRDLWMVSGERLLRAQGDTFVEVEHQGVDGAIVELFAHDGGVWLEGERQVCHVATAPRIGVVGVRPFERLYTAALTFEARVASDAAVTATLDGEPIALGNDNVGSVTLETAG
ncbi:MAG: hypothetical protein AAFX99_21705, partial [Myxococcota bacterium]